MEDILAFCQSTTQKMYKYIPTITWSEPAKAKVETVTQTYSKLEPPAPPKFNPPGGSEFIRQGHVLVRLAGLSGAAAVALGAYGAHAFAAEKQDLKKVYDTANFYHFIHSLALLGVPLSKRPYLTGCLMVGGMTIFCGTIYYHALTEEKTFRRYTPYGGMMLIAAWLSMVI